MSQTVEGGVPVLDVYFSNTVGGIHIIYYIRRKILYHCNPLNEILKNTLLKQRGVNFDFSVLPLN